jgi:GMP synthase (glutamine-hydrolysing)
MNILCITHADFENPGSIETWALKKGFKFQIVKPYQGEKLDHAFDMLIVMGGPQSSTTLDEYPYLADEIALIKEAILQGKRILGFCLGAQLIGEALGASAERSPDKEVGVYPVFLTDDASKDELLADLPRSFPVIHWHNDMPGLLEDSALLAYSEGCPRQIIRYKSLVYGFQCHLEIDLNGIKAMVEAVPGDLQESRFTQTKQELLEQDYEAINNMMTRLLDRFIDMDR